MTKRTLAAACVGASVPIHAVHAHAADAASTAVLGWTAGSGEAALAALLALTLVVYATGAWRLYGRRRRGASRLRREAALFGLGWLVMAGSLLSPLHAAAARSFTLHMLEHELLMLVAAPLLAWSRPLATMLWSLPRRFRHAIASGVRTPAVTAAWRSLREPATATILQAAALWIWHVPALFELALAHEGWHYVQHASFLATALLFWSSIARATQAGRGHGVAACCLFVTSLVGGALGALMALSESPWYAGYARLGLTPFGLTPTEDQQLAGLLMWIPGGFVHVVAALWIVAQALRPGARGARTGSPEPAGSSTT